MISWYFNLKSTWTWDVCFHCDIKSVLRKFYLKFSNVCILEYYNLYCSNFDVGKSCSSWNMQMKMIFYVVNLMWSCVAGTNLKIMCIMITLSDIISRFMSHVNQVFWQFSKITLSLQSATYISARFSSPPSFHLINMFNYFGIFNLLTIQLSLFFSY